MKWILGRLKLNQTAHLFGRRMHGFGVALATQGLLRQLDILREALPIGIAESTSWRRHRRIEHRWIQTAARESRSAATVVGSDPLQSENALVNCANYRPSIRSRRSAVPLRQHHDDSVRNGHFGPDLWSLSLSRQGYKRGFNPKAPVARGRPCSHDHTICQAP